MTSHLFFNVGYSWDIHNKCQGCQSDCVCCDITALQVHQHFNIVYHFAKLVPDHKYTGEEKQGKKPYEPQLFLLQEKPEDPQIEPHAGIKIAQGLVISLLYICVPDT